MGISRIIGSATELPAAAAGPTLIAEMAGRALRRACDEAGISPSQVGLIVTLSVSPSHQGGRADIVGPRFGYVLQRDLAIEGAFVLDLIDNDWAFALDQTILFAQGQGIAYAALMRGENLARMRTPHPAFRDGAGALLVEIGDERSDAAFVSLGTEPFLTLDLEGDGARMRDNGLPAEIPEAGCALLETGGHDRVYVEGWAPGWRADDAGPAVMGEFGIFAIPQLVSGGSGERCALVSLDPFKARLGRIVVAL
jgi:hypothetical protein